ncbi:MAG: hypothetical protein K1X57_06275 [Gemmataceae bacterium]|nr:hypothetical protein [Gemmataceae bacterium]
MATAELTHDTGIPADVREFAAKHDFTQYLAPLAAAVETAFPDRPYRWYMEEDAEVAGDYRIILEVNVAGWSREEIRTGRQAWEAAELDACPPSVVCVYCLRLEKA